MSIVDKDKLFNEFKRLGKETIYKSNFKDQLMYPEPLNFYELLAFENKNLYS